MFGPHINPRRLEDNYLKNMMASPVKRGMVMLYGDSCFTRWQPLYGNVSAEDVLRSPDGSQAVVNHGFGTSTAEELLYYYPMLVRPWAPKALVLKAYGNDRGAGYSPMEIINLHARTMDYARADFPGIKLYLFKVFPLLKSRDFDAAEKWAVKEYNDLVCAYAAAHPDVTLIDGVTMPGLYRDGDVGNPDAIRDELYIKDRVHFSPEGYALFADFMRDQLKDVL